MSTLAESGTALRAPVNRLCGLRRPHPRRVQRLADVAGAAAAAAIVAIAPPVSATADALTAVLTFLVFLGVGATFGRRTQWSAMLPFASVLFGLLQRGAAAVCVWAVLEATAVAHPAVPALAVAAVAAAAATGFARRVIAQAPTRIAVLGSPRLADQLRSDLLRSGDQGHELVGVVVLEPPGDALAGGEVAVLGTMAALADLIERYDLDMLLIDGEASRIEVFDGIADTCLDLPVRVCELSQFYEDALGHVPVTAIGSTWFRYIMHPRFRSADTDGKRALDIAVVVVAGVAFLPLLGLCALLIKLQDGGTVLFRQPRIGSHGAEFTMLKLRTMRMGAPVVKWTSTDDERVTPVGRVMRRTHVDELPQMFNILRGEMSVVGPRPEQPHFVEWLERSVPHYNRRHMIKPGLTGWAQVRCGYAGSDAGSAWKLCHDLYYLKHRSLALDLAILAETTRMLVADRQVPARAEEGILAVATHDGGAGVTVG
jgi:exopolysaccharide biosynthesis polyprenyl glycosylphosphotransferase